MDGFYVAPAQMADDSVDHHVTHRHSDVDAEFSGDLVERRIRGERDRLADAAQFEIRRSHQVAFVVAGRGHHEIAAAHTLALDKSVVGDVAVQYPRFREFFGQIAAALNVAVDND